MESHPIPQDITSFQFKLIGDMTIKQFAYLAFGAVVSWLFIIMPIISIIKVPIAFMFALFGIGLAFFPIEGRPMDIMIANFLKSLFTPTQYVYDRKSGTLLLNNQQSMRQQNPLEKIQPSHSSFFSNILPKNLKLSFNLPYDKKPAKAEKPTPVDKTPEQIHKPHIITFSELGQHAAQQQAPPSSKAVELENQDNKEKEEEKETQSLQAEEKREENEELELEKAKLLEKTSIGSPDYNLARQKVLELEKLFHETLAQKQILERQILGLRNSLEAQKRHIYSPGVSTPKNETQTVRQIAKGAGKSVGLPITPDVPNLITGIIKDPRGNPLPNMLVEVKDSGGNAVRAFKTNALGQFASATPLANGVYSIWFEDPRGQNKFDAIEIKAGGEIILPLEVISQDTREELRQSLFSQQAN